jgi:hypothetical protein
MATRSIPELRFDSPLPAPAVAPATGVGNVRSGAAAAPATNGPAPVAAPAAPGRTPPGLTPIPGTHLFRSTEPGAGSASSN